MKSPRSRAVVAGMTLAAFIGGVIVFSSSGEQSPSPVANTPTAATSTTHLTGTVEMHRTATCECCGEHRDYLAAAGFDVVDRTHTSGELTDLKHQLGIPEGTWSCHTTVIDGYAVEGHVPVDVIAELLNERPEIDGIALPGMPGGAPGMGGVKDTTWRFIAFIDGVERGAFTQR